MCKFISTDYQRILIRPQSSCRRLASVSPRRSGDWSQVKALQLMPSAWHQVQVSCAKPPETWAQWFPNQLLFWALFFHIGLYEPSKINIKAKQSRVKFLKQWRVWPSFVAASNIGARSVVASFLFQAGKIGRWWNEYSPEALENWRQMTVHRIRQALAEEQEHALMDTSSRDTCFHITAIASGNH